MSVNVPGSSAHDSAIGVSFSHRVRARFQSACMAIAITRTAELPDTHSMTNAMGSLLLVTHAGREDTAAVATAAAASCSHSAAAPTAVEFLESVGNQDGQASQQPSASTGPTAPEDANHSLRATQTGTRAVPVAISSDAATAGSGLYPLVDPEARRDALFGPQPIATVAAAACDDSAAAPHADVDSLKLDAQASHQPSATAAAAAPDAVVAIHKVSHNTMRVHGRREKWSWLDQV